MSWAAFAPPVIAAVVGAITGTVGAYLIQRHLERQRRVDAIRRDLREFLDVVAAYWTARSNPHEHLIARMRIRTQKDLIIAEFATAAALDRQVGAAHRASLQDRLELWDAATGGRFEQESWQPDPVRVSPAARSVGRILRTLPA